jgi:hypothetical protein
MAKRKTQTVKAKEGEPAVTAVEFEPAQEVEPEVEASPVEEAAEPEPEPAAEPASAMPGFVEPGMAELVWVRLAGASTAVLNGKSMLQGETAHVPYVRFKQANGERPGVWQLKLPGWRQYRYV